MEEDEDVYVRYMKLVQIRNIRRDFYKTDKKGSELAAPVRPRHLGKKIAKIFWDP